MRGLLGLVYFTAIACSWAFAQGGYAIAAALSTAVMVASLLSLTRLRHRERLALQRARLVRILATRAT